MWKSTYLNFHHFPILCIDAINARHYDSGSILLRQLLYILMQWKAVDMQL